MKIELDMGERETCGDCIMSNKGSAWTTCQLGFTILSLTRKSLGDGKTTSWDPVRPAECVQRFGK